MASDHLMAMEQPWIFRSTFADAWVTDIFPKESDTLTNDLHKSVLMTSSDGDAFPTGMAESLLETPAIVAPFRMPAESGAPVSKHSRSIGRVAKRKSRASKSAMMTFIKADPANFRQMVQQVTGARLGVGGLNGQLPVVEVLKPEPQRNINRLLQARGLSTLDTSTSFLDGSTASLIKPPRMAAADGGASTGGINCNSFCSFPTLESWKVM